MGSMNEQDHPEPPEQEHSADSEDDALLREFAARVRADPELQALVPLSQEERDEVAREALRRTAPRRRPVRWVLAFAAAAALAAGGLWAARRGAEPEMVAYSLSASADSATRGDTEAPQEVLQIRPDTRLKLTLTPAAEVRDAALRLVLVRDGRARVFLLPAKSDGAGTFTVDETASALLGAQTNGDAELVVVIGRSLPGDDELAALVLGPAEGVPRSLRVLRRAARFVEWGAGALDVELGRCRGVTREGVCEVEQGARLSVWISAARGQGLSVHVDGRPSDAAPRPHERGLAWEVAVPEGARELSLRLDGAVVRTWELQPDRSAPDDELGKLRRDARTAARAGDAVTERKLREQAARLAGELGRLSVEIDESIAVVHGLLFGDNAIKQATARLKEIGERVGPYPRGRALVDYYRGLIAWETGDIGQALSHLRAARDRAARLGEAAVRDATEAPLAQVLGALGRTAELRELAGAIAARARSAADPCQRAQDLTNVAWLLRDDDAREARASAEEAARAAAEGCRSWIGETQTNLAFLRAGAGDAPGAREALAAARGALAGDRRSEAWLGLVEAELSLKDRPGEALDAADALARREASEGLEELAAAAVPVRARALAALGREREAVDAFREAERRLDAWARSVPLGEGRIGFLARRDIGAHAVAFHLGRARRGSDADRRGAIEDLAWAVRRSVARFSTSTAGASPSETPPAPGEVAISVHPAGAAALAIVQTAGATDMHDLAAPDPAADPAGFTAHLAKRVAPAVKGASRIRLHAYRALGDALRDDRLSALTGVPVARAFDVPGPARPAARCEGPPVALVVTDPSGDLPRAHEAAERLRSRLRAWGLDLQVLTGKDATVAAVRAALESPCTAFFHYAGHADAHRLDGAEDALRLSDGALSAAAVKGLARSPRRVVLNGCATSAVEGLGLAHAFLAAGAEQVVATRVDVGDADAERFDMNFYNGAPHAGPPDLTVRLAEAALVHAAEGRPEIAAAYRAFER